jgi:hypothetical protein
MWKIVAAASWMVVSGAVTLFVATLIVMELGEKFHSSHEYYRNYPVLYWGPAVIGFLIPGVVVWYLDRRGVNKGWKVVGTLALMVTSGVIAYAVEWQIIWELGRRLQGDDIYYWRYPAVNLGFHSFAIIGFLAPGMLVWYLHRKATTNRQSH